MAGELICLLRVKPDRSVTEESFTCEVLEPISVSSPSMFQDGQQLISNVVHVVPNADDSDNKVPRTSNFVRFLFHLLKCIRAD